MDMSLSKVREIVKDRGAWRAAVLGVTESRKGLRDPTATTTNEMPKLKLALSTCSLGPQEKDYYGNTN